MTSSRSIVLISCGKRKRSAPSRARDLYHGDLFKKSLAYAESLVPAAIRILSAKHYVLHPETVIAPYDRTLNTMAATAVKTWAGEVVVQLAREFDLEEDHFTILAGASYRRYLEPHLRHFDVPMQGLGIGKQLRFLNERTNGYA